MIVWIVFREVDYEGSEVVEIFHNDSDAIKYCDNYIEIANKEIKFKKNKWEKKREGYYRKPYTSLTIEMYEVR
jgi:hypothetical protein